MNNRLPPLRPADTNSLDEIHAVLINLRMREEQNTNNPQVVDVLCAAAHEIHVVRTALRKRFTPNAC